MAAVKKIIIKRCSIVDSGELKNTEALFDRRIRFWKKGFQHYGDAGNFQILKSEGYIPLLYSSSAEIREEIVSENRSLSTPTSMRGVDTESSITIYSNIENYDEE